MLRAATVHAVTAIGIDMGKTHCSGCGAMILFELNRAPDTVYIRHLTF